MNEDGMLVSRRWLERVDAALFGSSAPGASFEAAGAGLFYDLRPAVLASSWTQNAAGVWSATANFLVNDVVDASFTFPVYAPTTATNPGGTAGTTRFFVIWRGRWEANVLPVGGQTLWTESESGGEGAEPLPSSETWGCHVEIGKGLALYNAGSCGHGATDGYIVGIKATAGTDAALAYGSFVSDLGEISTKTINVMTNATTVSALSGVAASTVEVLSAAGVSTVSAVTGLEPATATVLTGLGTPSGATIPVIDSEPTTVDVVAGYAAPTTAAVLSAANMASQTVLTGLGTPTTAEVLSASEMTSQTVLTGLGTPTTASVKGVQTVSTGVALASLGTPTTDSFLKGTVGTPQTVLTGASLALNGTATNAVQVLTGVECRNGGVYGIYSTLSIVPTTGSITPINNPTTADALTGLGTPTTSNVVTAVSTSSQSVLTGLGTPSTASVPILSSSSTVNVLTSLGTPQTATINVPTTNSSVDVLTSLGTPTLTAVSAPISTSSQTVLTGLGTPSSTNLTYLASVARRADVLTTNELETTYALADLTTTTVGCVSAASVSSETVVTAIGAPTKRNAVVGYRE